MEDKLKKQSERYSKNLLNDIDKITDKIKNIRKNTNLTEDQLWRLTMADAQIGMAGAYIKIFAERRHNK